MKANIPLTCQDRCDECDEVSNSLQIGMPRNRSRTEFENNLKFIEKRSAILLCTAWFRDECSDDHSRFCCRRMPRHSLDECTWRVWRRCDGWSCVASFYASKPTSSIDHWKGIKWVSKSNRKDFVSPNDPLVENLFLEQADMPQNMIFHLLTVVEPWTALVANEELLPMRVLVQAELLQRVEDLETFLALKLIERRFLWRVVRTNMRVEILQSSASTGALWAVVSVRWIVLQRPVLLQA